MTWRLPIAIPTRGGASVQTTFNELPDELKPFVTLFVGAPSEADCKQILVPTGIAEKRQFILDYYKEDFVMVDDDVSFKAPDMKSKVSVGDFYNFQKTFDDNTDIALLCDSGRFMFHVQPELSRGTWKFVAHRKSLIDNERYDIVDIFEDADFYFQLLNNRKKLRKCKAFLSTNRTADYAATQNYDQIKLRWKKEFSRFLKVADEESVYAGKKLDFKLKIGWLAAEKPSSNLQEFF